MTAVTAGRSVMVVESDGALRERASKAFAALGLKVYAPLPNAEWLEQSVRLRPDYLLVDQQAVDGCPSELIRSVKAHSDLERVPLILLTADGSAAGRAEAYAQGADECLAKPYDEDALQDVLLSLRRFELTFWGIRGTLPVPGSGTLRYGGNTSCVSLSVARDRQFVIDAGTGMKILSDHLRTRFGGRFDGHILISHPHWDHLNCLPFFAPFYVPGNRIQLHGPPQGRRSLRDLIDGQMDGVYFPITVEEFRADVVYQDLFEGDYCFDGIRVETKRLQHPGHCLAYRISHAGRSMAYVSDNELGCPDAARLPCDPPASLVEFLLDTDLLIHDTTYFDDEYPNKVDWGHSSVSQVAQLAHAARVKDFYLYHHDPSHDDAAIERKLAIAQRRLEGFGSTTRCHIAEERLTLDLQRVRPDGS